MDVIYFLYDFEEGREEKMEDVIFEEEPGFFDSLDFDTGHPFLSHLFSSSLLASLPMRSSQGLFNGNRTMTKQGFQSSQR